MPSYLVRLETSEFLVISSREIIHRVGDVITFQKDGCNKSVGKLICRGNKTFIQNSKQQLESAVLVPLCSIPVDAASMSKMELNEILIEAPPANEVSAAEVPTMESPVTGVVPALSPTPTELSGRDNSTTEIPAVLSEIATNALLTNEIPTVEVSTTTSLKTGVPAITVRACDVLVTEVQISEADKVLKGEVSSGKQSDFASESNTYSGNETSYDPYNARSTKEFQFDEESEFKLKRRRRSKYSLSPEQIITSISPHYQHGGENSIYEIPAVFSEIPTNVELATEISTVDFAVSSTKSATTEVLAIADKACEVSVTEVQTDPQISEAGKDRKDEVSPRLQNDLVSEDDAYSEKESFFEHYSASSEEEFLPIEKSSESRESSEEADEFKIRRRFRSKYSLSPDPVTPSFSPHFQHCSYATSESTEQSAIRICSSGAIAPLDEPYNCSHDNNDDSPTTTKSASPSYGSPQSSQRSPSSSSLGGKTNLATVRIINSEWELKVLTTIHSGRYMNRLTKFSGAFYGFINKETDLPSDHQCDDASQICVGHRTTTSYEIDVTSCLKHGFFHGTEENVGNTSNGPFLVELTNNDFPPTSTAASFQPPQTKTKKHFCIFCKTLVTTLPRHFKLKHENEEDIKTIFMLPPRSKERKSAFQKLRLQGDREYNDKCSPSRRIFVRRPFKTFAGDGVRCVTCGGMFARRDFSRHEKKCSKRAPNDRRVTALAQVAMKPVASSFEQKLMEKLLMNLQDDDIAGVIRRDYVMQLFANYFAQLGKSFKHRDDNARQQLRRLGRLLIHIKSHNELITSFEDCLQPKNIDLLIQNILSLCGFNEETEQLKFPSVATTYNGMITRCCELLRDDYIIRGREQYFEKLTHLQDFLLLWQKRFFIYISKGARKTSNEKKLNRKGLTPTVEDCKMYSEYIKKTVEENYRDLKDNGFNSNKWLQLGKGLLLQLMLFNRRRVGESSTITLQQFLNRRKLSEQDMKNLTIMQKILAEDIEVVHTIGKRQRKLAILIFKRQIEQLELYVSMRKDAGVAEDNVFLFASHHRKGHLEAWVIVRKFAAECGAKQPEALRGTLLRKQIATISQVLNMSDNDIQLLADFMGHDPQVHRQYYRTPELTTEVTVLSSFLMAVTDVDIESLRGKSLQELSAMPMLQSELSDQETESSGEEELNLNISSHEEGNPTSVDDEQMRPETPAEAESFSEQQITPKKGKDVNVKKRLFLKTPTKTPQPLSKTPTKSPRRLLLEESYPPRRRPADKKRWNPAEKAVMRKIFGSYLQDDSGLPQMECCRMISQKYSNELGSRSGRALYAWVNCEKKRLRKQKA